MTSDKIKFPFVLIADSELPINPKYGALCLVELDNTKDTAIATLLFEERWINAFIPRFFNTTWDFTKIVKLELIPKKRLRPPKLSSFTNGKYFKAHKEHLNNLEPFIVTFKDGSSLVGFANPSVLKALTKLAYNGAKHNTDTVLSSTVRTIPEANKEIQGILALSFVSSLKSTSLFHVILCGMNGILCFLTLFLNTLRGMSGLTNFVITQILQVMGTLFFVASIFFGTMAFISLARLFLLSGKSIPDVSSIAEDKIINSISKNTLKHRILRTFLGKHLFDFIFRYDIISFVQSVLKNGAK